MSKRATLLLITVLAVSSLIIVSSAFAQSIPKPSVPEFTVELVDSSYDVPTTYSIDPFTGENVTHAGHHVENKSIEVRIKNQPFTPVLVQTGTSTWTAYFYYNVRVKGHYSVNWINLYSPAVNPLNPSKSDYTVLSFPLTLSPTHPEQGHSLESYDINFDSHSPEFSGLPSNAQIDFQVEAMIGYLSRTVEFASWHFTGEESGWSNTQTITIGESQTPTPSPATTPTPTHAPTPSQEPQQTDQTEIIVGAAIAAVVIGAGLGLLIYLIKRK